METPAKSFKIRFTKKVVFWGSTGNIKKVYLPGDIADALGPQGNPGAQYFDTGMGEIYMDEAEEVKDDENS